MNPTWRALVLLVGAAAFAACADEPGHTHDDNAHSHGGEHDHAAEPGHGHGHGDGDLRATAVTHFTHSAQDSSETELFVEFGPLIVGEETAFAAHFTDCGALWTPVEEGRLTVQLRGGGPPDESFSVTGPTVPGIFRPVAKPTAAGTRQLRFVLEREHRQHVHDVGEVVVYADRAAAEKALAGEEEEEDSGAISFLKEQAWKLDFALTEVKREPLSPTLRVFGELLPRSDGQARVSASASGRLVGGKDGLPRVGAFVERGDELAHLVPSVSGGGNLAAILLQKEKGGIAAAAAQRELDRVTRLVEEGAIPARRVQEAEARLARARAEVGGAERLLAQYQGAVTGGRAPGGVKIVAPIAGVLTEVPVVAGSYVEEGETLFSIVDTSVLWLSVRVPEVQRQDAATIFGGAFRPTGGVWRDIPPRPEGYQPSAVLDPRDRTFPLRIPIENQGGELFAGTHVIVDLAVAPPEDRLAAPRDAVVYEQGVPVVYVMVEGESFERRVVKVGGENGARVLLAGGVAPGERVVSTGAMYVKLASTGGAAPAHGHPH